LSFRTPGGSSGGEGALFAAGGTPFGTESDLAGSLRIPAAFCGFITLKPTQDRLVVTNTDPGIPGRSRYGLSFGFFTNTVTEQVELLKLFLGNSSYRQLVPTSIPLPLNEEICFFILLFFFFLCAKLVGFGLGTLTMTVFAHHVRRGVLETVERLKREGHDLVPFTVPNVDEMVQLLYKSPFYLQLLMPDGGHYIRALYENDVIDPYMKDFVMLLKYLSAFVFSWSLCSCFRVVMLNPQHRSGQFYMSVSSLHYFHRGFLSYQVPRSVRWLASFVLRPISPQLSAVCSAFISNLDDLRYTNERCDVYKKEFIAYWKSLELDALICPSFPVPAVPHRFPSKMSIAATYTALFNLLDFPAGVVPVGKVAAKDDKDLVNESTYP
uniref:Amidase domain-containing protein n=1 Tax=Angiostrongylus cantonensis TaxID=6313 RepID=A0A0K0D8I9_ANGCA